MVLDRAITNEAELHNYLSELLGAEVTEATVVLTDLVLDKTTVDVTYRVAPGGSMREPLDSVDSFTRSLHTSVPAGAR